jgi:hypothetical protein
MTATSPYLSNFYARMTGTYGLQQLTKYCPDNCQEELESLTQAIALYKPFTTEPGGYEPDDLEEIHDALDFMHVPVDFLGKFSYINPKFAKSALIIRNMTMSSFNIASQDGDKALLKIAESLGTLASAAISKNKPATPTEKDAMFLAILND